MLLFEDAAVSSDRSIVDLVAHADGRSGYEVALSYEPASGDAGDGRVDPSGG